MYTYDEKTVSDLHKDAYGFRPGLEFWEDWDLASDEKKQGMWDVMVATMEDSIRAEAVAENLTMKRFESTILGIMGATLCTREHAVAMHLETQEMSSSELQYGGEYVCFKLGLPFSYTAEFDVVISQHFTEAA
jgi:hypothetical protein